MKQETDWCGILGASIVTMVLVFLVGLTIISVTGMASEKAKQEQPNTITSIDVRDTSKGLAYVIYYRDSDSKAQVIFFYTEEDKQEFVENLGGKE